MRAILPSRCLGSVFLMLGATWLAGCDTQIGAPQTGFVRFQRALALEDEDPNRARELMAQAVALDPQEAGYRTKLGYLLLNEGRVGEALEHFLAARRHDPGNLSVLEGLCWCYVKLEHPGAEPALSEYLEQDPTKHTLRAQRARIYLEDEQMLPLAASEYQLLVSAHPGVAEYHLALGNALWRLDKPDEAIKQYQDAVVADPTMAGASLALAYACRDRGRLDQAIVVLTRLLDSHPQLWEGRELLADLYAMLPLHRERALAEYQRILDHTDSRPEVRVKLARTLIASGQTARALDHLKSGVAHEPEREELQFLLFEALKEEGQLEEALAAFTRYERAAGQSYPVAVNVGFLLLELERYPQAATTFRHALTLNPKAEGALEGLAWSLLEADDPGAFEACEQLLDRAPRQWDLRERLADAYLLADRSEAALHHYRYLIDQQAPQAIRVRGKLARHLLALGQDLAALQQLRRVVVEEPLLEEYLFLTVDLLVALDRPEEAIVELQRAGRRAADLPTLSTRLGYLLLQQERPAEAVQAFQAAVEADPAQATAREGLCWALVAAGQDEEAIGRIRAYLANHPNQHRLRHTLFSLLTRYPTESTAALAEGRRLLDTLPHDMALAMQWLGFLHRTNPEALRQEAPRYLDRLEDPTEVRLWLADAYQQSGQLDAAIRELEAVVAADPRLTGAWTALGFALKEAERFEQAVEAFGRARAGTADPQAYLSALKGMAWCHVAAGQEGQAMPLLEQALILEPANVAIRETLADLLAADRGSARAAIEHYRTLRRQAPGEPRHLLKQLRAMEKVGLQEELMTLAEQALTAFPENLELRRYALRLMQEAGRDELVAGIYRDILKGSPADTETRLAYAYHLFDQGDLKGAMGEFQRVIRLDSGEIKAQEGLLWCLLKLEDRRAETLRQLRVILALDPHRRDLHTIYADLLAGHPKTAGQGRREYQRLLQDLPYDPSLDPYTD